MKILSILVCASLFSCDMLLLTVMSWKAARLLQGTMEASVAGRIVMV